MSALKNTMTRVNKVCTWILHCVLCRGSVSSIPGCLTRVPSSCDSEILTEGKRGRRSSEWKREREGKRGKQEVYRVAELAQQIGINGDKLSWPVIDEAHRPWREVTAVCTMFSLAPRSRRRVSTSIRRFSFYVDIRGVVSSVPLHAIAIVTIPRPAHLHAPLWMRQAVTVRWKSIIP